MKNKSGFVLIEIAVVFGMLAILTIMTVNNVFGSKRTATLTGIIDSLVADMKSQQMKAMSGAQTSGSSPLGYGIHFESTRYTLFRGIVYSPADSANAVVPIDDRVTFNVISLPNDNVIFASHSGEFVGYAPASSSITLRHADSGTSKTIRLNTYGVITSIN